MKKVIVAMSGGVDSSVAAALLKKQGLDVIGVYMKLNDFSKESEERARQVAKILNIPFYVLDLGREFKKRVINYFIEGYKKGITPNPCVVCNKEIKFGLLMEKALSLEADYIATGHYAKKTYNLQLKTCNLSKGKDKEKDQSYFLWKLNQKQLKHILFPVGDHTRKEVEKLAQKFGLPFSGVQKSVEICFIPDADTARFLQARIKVNKGPIVEQVHYGVNKIIGEHRGLWFYTIGQRKGIKLSGGPYYVVDKDIKKNILIVSKNEKNLLKKELIVKNVNWTSGKTPKLPMKIEIKIRYRSPSVRAVVLKLDDRRYKLIFTKPQRAITPGQSAVFYQGQELLGGGIIC